VGAKILVVDDEAGPRESLRMILNLEHDVRMASSGRQALTMIEESKPDLVFLDIRMPEMDGTEVLRRIKEIAPDVEVAMITAYAAVQSAQRAMRLGALDYITKPFGVAEVEAVVERAMAKRRKEREGRLLLEQLSGTISQLSEELSGTRRPTGTDGDDAFARGLASAHSSIEDQLKEVLRLSSIGEVAAEVAHDLNNFLSTILFRIEIMLLDVDQTQRMEPQALVDGLRQIALAARDGGEALERLSALSDSSPYEPVEKVDLDEVLCAAGELSEGRVDHSERHALTFDLEELPRIDGSPAGLRTVFTNLIINAYHAVQERGGDGEIRVRSYQENDEVVAQVADDGCGMTADVIARLSEPFFTTKGEGGTGLGLTVAHKVIAQHNGAITFDSTPHVGTTVTVRLPVSQAGVGGGRAPGLPVVLVVDDQEGMLVVTREVLQTHGFDVLTALSAEEALPLFSALAGDPERGAPRVVITDLRMPGRPGTELAREIKQIAPDTQVILLSAFLEEADPEGLEFADMALEKPFDLQKLSGIVREMVGGDTAAR